MSDKELRKLAEAATLGPWKAVGNRDGTLNVIGVIDEREREYRKVALCNKPGEANANYIAAADPPTILSLLDRLAAAERERDAARNKALDEANEAAINALENRSCTCTQAASAAILALKTKASG